MTTLTSSQSSAFPMALYYPPIQGFGSREERQCIQPVGLLLSGGSASVGANTVEWPLDLVSTTNAGLSNSLFKVKPPSTKSALQDIKSNTGLTWQQVTRIFKVSARSLHLWMDGNAMDSVHQERLYRVLALVRQLPFSKPFQNRAFLLLPHTDGRSPIDLLVSGEDEAFIRSAEVASTTPIASSSTFTNQHFLSPSILMDANQDNLHVDMPGRRTVKAVKRTGR